MKTATYEECLICRDGTNYQGHLEDILQRLEFLDDKPHQLFTALSRASHLYDGGAEELGRMSDLGIKNSHRLLED